MDIAYFLPTNFDGISEAINTINSDEDIKSIMLFMADNNQVPNDIFESLIAKCNVPVIGGVFPELIYQGERKKEGILIFPVQQEFQSQLFDLSSDPEMDIYNLKIQQSMESDIFGSLFIFIDALSPNKESFIENLFNHFGIFPTYFGGGAGSLSFESIPCIINNTGIHQNAAVIGWIPKDTNLGVAHGWHPISEPLKVTQAEGNKVIGIDWKPAFDVYKNIVETHSGLEFNDNNFFELAKSYPLGITRVDAEMIVRDPYAVKDKVIYTVDKVNEGQYISILHGDTTSLLQGAEKARSIALGKPVETPGKNTILCIDCISRVLFMQDEFNKELNTISQGMDINGILSIGEIANAGDSFLEIYNKTVVVSVC